MAGEIVGRLSAVGFPLSALCDCFAVTAAERRHIYSSPLFGGDTTTLSAIGAVKSKNLKNPRAKGPSPLGACGTTFATV